eukprot:355964-Chlamydomonas_euryale.AAC.3
MRPAPPAAPRRVRRGARVSSSTASGRRAAPGSHAACCCATEGQGLRAAAHAVWHTMRFAAPFQGVYRARGAAAFVWLRHWAGPHRRPAHQEAATGNDISTSYTMYGFCQRAHDRALYRRPRPNV